MSIPSASYCVQIGVMACNASAVSRQERPAMEPESSIRKMVSKVARKLKSVSPSEVEEEEVVGGTVLGCGIERGWVRGGTAL